MKRKFVFNTLFILAVMISTTLISTSVFAQNPILVEDFTYTAGALLTDNNWSAHSGAATNSIVTVTPGLTLTGYPSSGVGNAVSLTTSGEDDNRVFPVQSAGSVYAAFLVNTSEASVDPLGGYFFHLGPDPVGTTFRGRVFIRKDASNNVSFGLSKAGTTEPTIAFTGFTYALNTTYLVVVRYTIVDGATNDTVTLYVSTTTPATEPSSPILTAPDVTATDINPGSVALRQGTATTSPTVRVDGIRVGTSWASVTQASTVLTQNYLDFDGNGRTDFVVTRNVGTGGSGATNQRRWFINLNGVGTFSGADWGIQTDILTPGNFDADNRTDIAVWRPGAPGQSVFYILQSQTNTLRTEIFGQTGDDPTVIGDYDGDGRDDVAVYRAGATAGAQSTWFYRSSLNNPNGNISAVAWGVNGDVPAPGDYDGDGRNDFVIQRGGGAQATFWLNRTTGGITTQAFGIPTDDVVPGDYDGDGRTDVAVVRNSGGALVWYYLPSAGGAVVQRTFGASTDVPVQGEYDGDGRTDIGIWRASATAGATNFWYQGSTSGAVIVPFGATGDTPVANYNVH